MADFKLGRLKFKWRGDWATSTGYLIDDIIKYGGNSYVCIQNHTSPAGENLFYTDPGTYTDYWQLHGESFYFKGIYANATWYKLNDLVTYGGKQYRCTTQYTSSGTVLDFSKFEQYSDGIDFRGDYASDTQYRLNDLVKYGGRTYRTITEHTSASGGDSFINLGNFSLYSEGLAFLGDWATTTYYRLDDVVKFGSYQYKCTTAHTSGAGSTDFAEGNFTVYSEGLQFEDSYNASTVYQKGDVVTYGGYSYVWVDTNEGSGRTPADDSYWDIITTGFNATGVYAHGTAYKTGDTVQYGGNSYVSILNNINERPAQVDGSVNATYWKVVVEGFKWRGTWSSLTTYEVGDTVRYSSNSYTCLKDQQLNILPGSDATVWAIVAQGDTAAVLTTRGDMIVENAGGVGRLPLGLPGSFLTNDGLDIQWSTPSGGNVLWVSPSGTDGGTSTGTESAPFKTVGYALNRAKRNQIREVENISGYSGLTPSTYFNVRAVAYKEFTVSQVPDTTSFEISLGTSTFAHTYVNGGSIRKTDDSTLTVTDAPYNNITGVITITTSGVHGLNINDTIRLRGMNYTCSQGSKTYPETGSDSHYKVNTSGGISVTVSSGGSNHNVGDKLRIDGNDIGSTGPTGGDITTSTAHARSVGDLVEVRDLLVSCPSGNKTYPIHSTNTAFTVEAANLTGTTFQVDIGTSTVAQTYVSGGEVVKADTSRLAITDFVYNTTTGKAVITTATNGLSASDSVNLFGIQTTCEFGTKVYPQAPYSSVYPVVSTESVTELNIFLAPSNIDHTYVSGGTVKLATVSSVGGSTSISGATYDNVTGLFTVTSTAHGLANNDLVKVENILMSCSMGSKTYPDMTFSSGIFKVYNVVDANTYIFGTDKSGFAHTYVSGGTSQKVTYTTSEDKSVDDFTYKRIASSTALTMDVASVAGDVLRVKNGTFKETLPLRIRADVSLVGESLRNTIIQPASGKGTQIKTVKIIDGPSGATDKEYNYLHPDKVEKSFKVVSTPDSTSFTINPGTDSNVHTYVGGGVVTTAGFGVFDISDAPYNNDTGVITITTTASHGLSPNAIIKLSGLKYSCIYGEKTYPEVGQGSVFNVNIIGGEAKEIITYHGGSGFNVGDVITIGTDKIGNGGDLILRVGELEDNNACNMFLTNDGNNIRNSTFNSLSGTKKAGGLYQITVNATDSFTVPTSIAESAHNYVSGGSVTSEFDEFTVASTPDGTSFTIDLDTSAFAHTYISGGQVRKADNSTLTVSDAPYNNATGVITITTSGAHGLSATDIVKVANLKYTCSMGEKIYPKVGTSIAVGSMAFAHATGEITVNTSADHNLQTGDYITLSRAKWNITDVGQRQLPKGVIESAVMSLDPSGNILIKSPYIQNCTSVNPGACGLQVDGNLHRNTYTRSYKSMLGNDFTQINSDGIGIHILGNGRVEAVSVFIYYCDKAIWAESGGFIRGLNCSHAYGERACVSSGTDEDETPVNVQTRGLMLKWDATGFLGGSTVLDIENSIAVQGQGTAVIQGDTSGATAKIFRFNNSLLYLHIENISGSFQDGETCTIEKEDSSTFQITLASGFGTPAQQGQRGPLLAIKSDRPTFEITTAGATSFTTPLGISQFAHTYVSGGSVIKPDTTTVAVTAGTTYNNLSGLLTVTTTTNHGLTTGDVVTMEGLLFNCDQGNKTYPVNGLYSNNIIKLASNVKFAGDDKYFRVGLVSEEDVTAGTAVIRLTEDIGSTRAKGDSIAAAISEGFSNIRLTGHDFLNIGTGDFVSTNYPHTPIQPADQADEVVEEDGGRIYWVSTDQQGDFRVGDLFKIEQATGTATLNADAFNLSGLSELKLGSIGAELGAAINEFSTDETMGGNSNSSVPTENAVLGYMTRDKSGTGAWVPPTGTTGQRPVGGSLYAGALRYNASIYNWEGYNGTSWTGLGGGTPWTTVVADGSTLTTATSGQRFLVNTQTAAATINLPPTPLVGDSVVFLDLAGTFQTNNLIVGRNGNDIMNLAEDMNVTTNHAGFSLIYTGATNGWKLVEVA